MFAGIVKPLSWLIGWGKRLIVINLIESEFMYSATVWIGDKSFDSPKFHSYTKMVNWCNALRKEKENVKTNHNSEAARNDHAAR